MVAGPMRQACRWAGPSAARAARRPYSGRGVPSKSAWPCDSVEHGPRDALGTDEVGVDHAEGLEDPLAEVVREWQAAHVLDDLAERGEPVVRIGEGRPRLDDDPEAVAVVVG